MHSFVWLQVPLDKEICCSFGVVAFPVQTQQEFQLGKLFYLICSYSFRVGFKIFRKPIFRKPNVSNKVSGNAVLRGTSAQRLES